MKVNLSPFHKFSDFLRSFLTTVKDVIFNNGETNIHLAERLRFLREKIPNENNVQIQIIRCHRHTQTESVIRNDRFTLEARSVCISFGDAGSRLNVSVPLIMHTFNEMMPLFRENKSFCSCVGEEAKKLSCVCGEMDHEPIWKWDENAKTPTTVLSQNCQKVYFHKGYSVGNACVRGDTPLTPGNDYYWEIKMCSNVYGTSMMVGIGTKSFNINQLSEEFRSLLGCDSESWGLKFDGTLYHDNKCQSYSPKAGFTIGSIIGVHLDMWNGTLEFYLNRIPLGLAFTGLRNKVLYPLLSSTASHTAMKLIYAHSEPHSLLLMSVKYLNKKLLSNLPPGLKSYSRNCWWLFPKSSRQDRDKKFDFVPSLNSIDLFTDSDSDSEAEEKSKSCSDCNVARRVFDNSTLHGLRLQGNAENHHFYFSHLRSTRAYRHKFRPWMDF